MSSRTTAVFFGVDLAESVPLLTKSMAAAMAGMVTTFTRSRRRWTTARV